MRMEFRLHFDCWADLCLFGLFVWLFGLFAAHFSTVRSEVRAGAICIDITDPEQWSFHPYFTLLILSQHNHGCSLPNGWK